MAVEFDASIIDELKAKYKDMEAKGELLTEEALSQYLSNFRARFGPDRLKEFPSKFK
jgi:hypothetical protein